MFERILMVAMVTTTAAFGVLACKSAQLVFERPEEDYEVPPAIMELAKANVVQITIMGEGSCSGTVVDKRLLVTAAHCVPDVDPNAVAVDQKGNLIYPLILTVLGTPLIPLKLFRIDAAVLGAPLDSFSEIRVDNSDGDVFRVKEAVLCGYPLDSSKIRCAKAKHKTNSVFASLFDHVPIPGQSGGAVFSMDGKLIGIIHSATPDGATAVASTAGILESVRKGLK